MTQPISNKQITDSWNIYIYIYIYDEDLYLNPSVIKDRSPAKDKNAGTMGLKSERWQTQISRERTVPFSRGGVGTNS